MYNICCKVLLMKCVSRLKQKKSHQVLKKRWRFDSEVEKHGVMSTIKNSEN